VTLGHVDVIARAALLFDEVVVAVLHNTDKRGTFGVDERIKLLDAALVSVPNVRIEAFAGQLLVDVCREAGAQAIVKGLRGGTDFAYELPMAQMNRHLSGVETVFLPGDPRYGHVSSSLIKEVAALGGDITGLVPEEVRAALLSRLQNPEGS
jgi:pantetheine-phosphate adenylyltransferase